MLEGKDLFVDCGGCSNSYHYVNGARPIRMCSECGNLHDDVLIVWKSEIVNPK